MELYIHETKIINFTYKTNSNCFNYYVSDDSVLHTDWIKDLGFMLDSK
jgi:hypothetical protein